MSELHNEYCNCIGCRGDKKFDFPDHLLEKIQGGEVVLFAGAGISTENPAHCKATFYEEIRAELEAQDAPSFPELMTRYCASPDGRIKLLEKIKRRFDYFTSFSDFHWYMTRFHRALAPLFMIKDVITTNWDDFFERECGFDAFVYDGDLAFWDASPRRVMKIHGSISNFGSIVATEDDYRQSFKRLNDGPLGAQLKSLISRKTVVYAGYSLSDPNYLRLLRNISHMMGDKIRHSYFVSPSIDPEKLTAAPIPLIPIETDGGYFLEQAREKLGANEIIREEAFDYCDDILSEAIEWHDQAVEIYFKKQHQLMVIVLGYQDGLIHALKRIKKLQPTGRYHSSLEIRCRAQAYEWKYDECIKRKDYWNAAYARGYQVGLLCLVYAHEHDHLASPPAFELPFHNRARSMSGVAKISPADIPRPVAQQLRRLHRSNARLGIDLVPDHTPYL